MRRNEADRVPADSPIAVIGISCRFPGASNPEAFWKLLRNGRSSISPAPQDRWERSTPVPDDIRYGGFLDRVDLFDADFFGISPREAAAADPQQRLLLELGWEAVEDAGLLPGDLAGSATGVFVGAILDDYAAMTHRQMDAGITRHSLTGTHRSLIANRLSYVLGLNGPSLTVDSGQSSALVAVHLACESLRRGESALALAGGVNLNLLADSTLRVARFGGLSPDGRCHTFDARANGYVRGEGGGLVLLKPLAAALADGDPVLGVVLGSAVNNDGGGAGLTTPVARTQQEVVLAACRHAGVEPADLQYVELHGTGTPVGDPVEAAALGAAVGAAKEPGSPLLVGSAKTNVGHLEGAAGIVGLLKTLLAVAHRRLPASLNFASPNPDIPLERLNLDVVRELRAWPEPGRPLLAGVSAWGMGGTNCHLVLGEAPQPADPPAGPSQQPAGHAVRTGQAGQAVPWPLSGRTEAALRAQAARLLAYTDQHPGLDPADVGLSLALHRTAFEHRATVVAEHPEDFRAGLAALAEGLPCAQSVEGVAAPGKVVFLFPGQGSQWAGMAAGLLESSPVFADSLTACADALRPYTDWSLMDVLRGGDLADSAVLERVDVVQPALFAVMVSLAALWRSAGVEPDAVAGHSQGEIAAAYVAGALGLDDAARLVALRSRAVRALSGRGGLLSVQQNCDALAGRIAASGGRLDIAVVNGPAATVVSGDPAALDELRAALAAEGVEARRIAVDYASHSPQVAEIREPLLADLAGITPRAGAIPFYSTVTGGLLDTTALDAEYWYRNLRRTVRFEATVRSLLADGHRAFIEASPHPVLAGGLRDILDDSGSGTCTGSGAEDGPEGGAGPAFGTGTLRRGDGGRSRFLTSLAEVHTRGVPVHWPAVFAGTGARRTALPTYAFQGERHWLDAPSAQLPGQPATPVPAAAAAPEPAARRLSGLPAPEQRRQLAGLVAAHAGAVLGRSAGSLTATRPFKELGLDSLGAAELLRRLGTALGLKLPTALAYNHPSPAALAAHLQTLLAAAEQPSRGQLLGRIDELTAELTAALATELGAAAGLDDGTREALTGRLRELLRRLDPPQQDHHRPAPSGDLTEAILSAGAQEIFDLIDSRGQL